MLKYGIIFYTIKRGDYMCRYIFGQYAYDLFSIIGILSAFISSLFFVKKRTNELGLYSKNAVLYVSKKFSSAGKFSKYFFAVIELLFMTLVGMLATIFTKPMGELMGTGFNYFGTLFAFCPLWFIASAIIKTNPLKNIDMMTMILPAHLFFIKIACFCNGCCWGIPWEYGPYNYDNEHPGNQVPVQAIEAFWAIVILAVLLLYRKKAKPGTVFPVYMILFSATRFCSEFFRHEENVLWIFKTYHLLCLSGIIIGFILYFIAVKYGDKIQSFFEKPHRKFDLKNT